jgi:hypothetical protein
MFVSVRLFSSFFFLSRKRKARKQEIEHGRIGGLG